MAKERVKLKYVMECVCNNVMDNQAALLAIDGTKLKKRRKKEEKCQICTFPYLG